MFFATADCNVVFFKVYAVLTGAWPNGSMALAGTREENCFTGCSGFPFKIGLMNVHEPVRALNQRAAREKWYYFCDPALTFSDSYYDALLNLWRTKAGGRPMPRRSEITARDLKDVLRNIVLFERVACSPSHYIWRLIGTSLTEITGHNTGKTFEETLSPEHVDRWVKCGDIILDGGQPLRFVGRVHLKGREYLDAENLFLPLANNDDKPAFAMGLCRYTPRRFQNDESWEDQIAAIPGALL